MGQPTAGRIASKIPRPVSRRQVINKRRSGTSRFRWRETQTSTSGSPGSIGTNWWECCEKLSRLLSCNEGELSDEHISMDLVISKGTSELYLPQGRRLAVGDRHKVRTNAPGSVSIGRLLRDESRASEGRKAG